MTRDEKRNNIVMALECAASYVSDDENLELAETDIVTAGKLLEQLIDEDKAAEGSDS